MAQLFKNSSLQQEGLHENDTLGAQLQCVLLDLFFSTTKMSFCGSYKMQVQRQCFHCATGFTCFWGRHKFNVLLEAPVTPLSIWHTGVSNKYKHKIKCYQNQVKRMSKLETIFRSPWQIAGQLLLGTNHFYPPPIFFFLKIQWGTMDNCDRYMMQHTEWVLQPLCSVIAA